MHPVLVVIPVAALALLPGLWAKRLLQTHGAQTRESLPTGHDLARRLLDDHRLQRIRVEPTDLGDHYDPEAKAVRLARDKYDRNTLAAVTTAAHEVAHALQDDAEYPPFVWRTRLMSLARVTGQVGSVLLIAVPTAALISRRPIPPALVSAPLFIMLATGLAVQLAAVPTELDASFRRALSMLRGTYLDAQQTSDAHKILLATSSTYVAASLLSVLHIWPWLGPPRRGMPIGSSASLADGSTAAATARSRIRGNDWHGTSHRQRSIRDVRKPRSWLAQTVRVLGKPLLRSWLRASRIRRLT
jgi:Zn-dependent membrane protease YugP